MAERIERREIRPPPEARETERVDRNVADGVKGEFAPGEEWRAKRKEGKGAAGAFEPGRPAGRAKALEPASSVDPKSRQLFDQLLAGEDPKIPPEELQAMQATALRVIDRLFNNQFGNDGTIRDRAGEKLQYFNSKERGPEYEAALFGGRGTTEKQIAALNFVLRTFRSPEDQPLRGAAMEKLGQVGRAEDAKTVVHAINKGTDQDLVDGLNAIRGITSRHGTPDKRGPLKDDPEIGPLLRQHEPLNDAQRTKVIEAVLQRGELDFSRTKELWRPLGYFIYFVRFKDTLPGPNGSRESIWGVFKPEWIGRGKTKPYSSREAAVYDFDRTFTKTGAFPPSFQTILTPMEGRSAQLGSVQWVVPDAEPLGQSDAGEGTQWYNPKWDHLRSTHDFRVWERKVRTVLHLISDPDHFANDVIGRDNLGNFIVQRSTGKVFVIDSPYSFGAAPREMSPQSILGNRVDPDVSQRVIETPSRDVKSRMSPYLPDEDADAAARRVHDVKDELRKRQGKG